MVLLLDAAAGRIIHKLHAAFYTSVAQTVACLSEPHTSHRRAAGSTGQLRRCEVFFSMNNTNHLGSGLPHH